MKKRVSALIIAVGMAAAPLSAKEQTKVKTASGELGNKLQNRIANTSKRVYRKKAEEEYIKEIEEEIENALHTEQILETSEVVEEIKPAVNETVLRDTMPNIGIDISEEFLALKGKSKSR